MQDRRVDLKDVSIQEFTAREGLRVRWVRGPQLLTYRIKIAASWLLSVQDAAGFWGAGGPHLTGAAVRALLLAEPYVQELKQEILAAVERAVNWLTQDDIIVRQPQGGLAWDPNLGTWDTAVVLRSLLIADFDDEEILNGVKEWLMNQAEESWFGATTVPFGESYPAHTFLALEEAGVRYYGRAQIGKIFERCQSEDGSWGKDHFNTSEVLLYLALHQENNRDAISKALDFIERTQPPNGAWSSWTWENAIALRAYLAHSTNPYNSVTVRALEYLIGLQHENGSWFHMEEDTANVVQTLCFALDRLDFTRFEASTDADFMVSRVSLLEPFSPELSIEQEHPVQSTVQLSKSTYNLIIIGALVVMLYFGLAIVRLLQTGWQRLTPADKWNVILNGAAEAMAAIISVSLVLPLIRRAIKLFRRKA